MGQPLTAELSDIEFYIYQRIWISRSQNGQTGSRLAEFLGSAINTTVGTSTSAYYPWSMCDFAVVATAVALDIIPLSISIYFDQLCEYRT
jgi:hypothetical protein